MFDAGKISQAVTDCLHKCYGSPLPLGALANFMAELSRDPHWTDYEIDAVEIRVLRVLSRIVSQSVPSHAASGADGNQSG